MTHRWPIAALFGLVALQNAAAQDSVRGAQLYLRLPGDVASCVTCHGPDPAQGRNNMLRAADNPTALLKALGDVGAMGYLKPVLSGADVVDLAAYLGRVAAMANPGGGGGGCAAGPGATARFDPALLALLALATLGLVRRRPRR